MSEREMQEVADLAQQQALLWAAREDAAQAEIAALKERLEEAEAELEKAWRWEFGGANRHMLVAKSDHAIRLKQLEAWRTLAQELGEALQAHRSQFEQGFEAHGIPLWQAQLDASHMAEAALARLQEADKIG